MWLLSHTERENDAMFHCVTLNSCCEYAIGIDVVFVIARPIGISFVGTTCSRFLLISCSLLLIHYTTPLVIYGLRKYIVSNFNVKLCK
jgi:hypothetical protein